MSDFSCLWICRSSISRGDFGQYDPDTCQFIREADAYILAPPFFFANKETGRRFAARRATVRHSGVANVLIARSVVDHLQASRFAFVVRTKSSHRDGIRISC